MSGSEIDQLSQSVSGNQAPPSSNDGPARASADLERELQYEKEARREERFIFLIFIVALLDAFLFMNMESWTGPVVIGLIQLIGFTVYARRAGVDEVVQLMDKLLAPFKRDKT
ncbi:hypothetical protein [Achromobacter sp. UBA4530]|uniref:hypothetical protein n=1 Tax=Achromobacter sp. UBA4530 TaxID=1945912 RepID=UPI0025811BB2|nr:hypothetical protein [Achromobacter sp. UBA4530]